LALLDVKDRTASDSFDKIDTTHLLVVALAAATGGDALPPLPAPVRADSPAASQSRLGDRRQRRIRSRGSPQQPPSLDRVREVTGLDT
jgi:hypothetical protein